MRHLAGQALEHTVEAISRRVAGMTEMLYVGLPLDIAVAAGLVVAAGIAAALGRRSVALSLGGLAILVLVIGLIIWGPPT